MSTHNLVCFRAKIRKNIYPCKPQFYYIKVEFKGVTFTRVCYLDGLLGQKSNKRSADTYFKCMTEG